MKKRIKLLFLTLGFFLSISPQTIANTLKENSESTKYKTCIQAILNFNSKDILTSFLTNTCLYNKKYYETLFLHTSIWSIGGSTPPVIHNNINNINRIRLISEIKKELTHDSFQNFYKKYTDLKNTNTEIADRFLIIVYQETLKSKQYNQK